AEVVSRHELLRTGIELSGYTEPLQLVYGQVKMPLGVEDIRDKNEEEQASEISKWMDEERKRGFQWGEAPLMRMMVHLRGTEDYQLTLSFHHAILDGWSLASLRVEIFQEYWREINQPGGRAWQKPKSTYRDYVRA